MPPSVIITAAKTVSRARVADFSRPAIIKVRIKDASMTVTATANTREPRTRADPVRDDLRMLHGGEDGTGEQEGADGHGGGAEIAAIGEGQGDEREQGST